MDDENPDDRRDAMIMGEIIMDLCDELWIFGDEVSPGMAAKIGYAKKKFKKIRRFGDV
ncbi:MAG: hypothetical protein LUD41_01100 [Phascolarctobacterium sp.]|nr:hypothetical protein [Phascolarctobacterium sp.]